MAENMECSPPDSCQKESTSGTLLGSNAFYSDFLEMVCVTKKKLLEMNDTICQLNCETSKAILEAMTLFDPKTLILIQKIEAQGRQMDKLVASTQERKKELISLAEEADIKPVEHYKAYLEHLHLLDSEK